MTLAFSLCVLLSLRSHPSRLLVLPQRVWTNPNGPSMWGNGHIWDVEPAFPVPEFPLLTGRQQSAVLAQLYSAHLHIFFLFLSGLWRSSRFLLFLCRPETKTLCQQQHKKHHRKLQGSAEGVELYRDKGCNHTDTGGFVMHLVITFIISYVNWCLIEIPMTLLLFFKSI